MGEYDGLRLVAKEVLEVSSTPRVSMSRLSLSRTVPSASRACSKSSSVRERRRWPCPWRSLGPTGWRPLGNEDGGTGDRGDGWRNSEARVEPGGDGEEEEDANLRDDRDRAGEESVKSSFTAN